MRVGDKRQVETDAFLLAEGLHLSFSKICAVVGDDVVRVAKSEDELLEELGCGLAVEFLDRFDFDPFGELVDCDEQLCHATASCLELTQHVYSPDCKWPCQRDGLQSRGG